MGYLQMGKFYFNYAIKKRKCWLCDEPILKDKPMLESWVGNNYIGIHTHHFNEEIINEIKLFLLWGEIMETIYLKDSDVVELIRKKKIIASTGLDEFTIRIV